MIKIATSNKTIEINMNRVLDSRLNQIHSQTDVCLGISLTKTLYFLIK